MVTTLIMNDMKEVKLSGWCEMLDKQDIRFSSLNENNIL